ncbi:MAG: hypothetical protein WA913_02295, partial [Pricia sp.]
MKKLNLFTTAAVLLIAFATFGQDRDDQDVIADAITAKEKVLDVDENLQTFFDNSTGYVIFPNVGEGGFILGAASGNGVLYEDGSVTGMADLKKVDVGLQIGGQSAIEVVFFETEEALNEFKQGELEFS